MDLLKNPYGEDTSDSEKVPVRNIVSENLYANLIPKSRKKSAQTSADTSGAEEKVMSLIQKSIRDNWPDETVLSRMAQRKMDVSRKVIILLFMATDGGTTDYGDFSDDDQTPEEIFEGRYERMKEMLIDCGFAPLDPRSSFDWMILYCMCVDDTFIIDERMRDFLTAMFAE